MAKTKFTNDTALDAALDVIRDNVTGISACDTKPTTRTEAITTYMLATKAITSANVQDCADYTGTGGGRFIQVDAQSDVDITNGGTAAYIALTSDSALLHVGTCTDLLLVAGQKVNFPAFDVVFNDPTAEA